MAVSGWGPRHFNILRSTWGSSHFAITQPRADDVSVRRDAPSRRPATTAAFRRASVCTHNVPTRPSVRPVSTATLSTIVSTATAHFVLGIFSCLLCLKVKTAATIPFFKIRNIEHYLYFSLTHIDCHLNSFASAFTNAFAFTNLSNYSILVF